MRAKHGNLLMDKRIARCGVGYWWPTQAWIHAFCEPGKSCVAAECKGTQLLSDRRKAAYRANLDYGVTEGMNDPVNDSIIIGSTYRWPRESVNNVDADDRDNVNNSHVDIIGAVEEVDRNVNMGIVNKATIEDDSPVSTDVVKSDRASYMREYMRRKRQEGKVKS